ncbi:hypothetical protein CSW57_15535 [Williamsia muralis]|uniref:Uncharacterized protein n=1 Tax=Williamsia marianensis TaxID=85044 RepID=A0A2G3PHD1_WILMA|nr:hypothetical protein CSW57_15535 [Williamsia marianensis]
MLQILIGRLAEGDSFEATFPGGHLRVERFRPEVGQSKVAEAIDADGPPADQPDPPVPSTGGPDAGRPDRLIDIDPDMAMLKAFIELETVARSKYYDLGIASKDKKSNFGRRPFSVAYLIPHLDAPVREAVLYLRGVRNGVVHGTESGYSETEASAYVRQAKAITHILRHNRGAILW